MLSGGESLAMTLFILRQAGWAGLLAACGAAAACSSNNPSTPDVFVAATVGVGSDVALCPFSGAPDQWLDIGVATGGNPTRITSGQTNGAGTVNVNCSVHPDGNGFDVSLSTELDGPNGGSLTIVSPGSGTVTTSGGSNISATFGSPGSGDYRESNCTITYTYNNMPVPSSPAIAAGRIWGHISCPNAQDAEQTGPGPDGGPTPRSCDAEADFLFEQCGQ
jgi:hypothetical protein